MSTELEKKPARPKKKVSQERLMLMFTLFFIGGVLLFTLVPEGEGPPVLRGILMSLYCMAVFWSMFRFAV